MSTETDDPFPTYVPPPDLPIDYVYPATDAAKPPRIPKPPPKNPRSEPPRRIKPKEWEQALEMYRAGFGWKAIGRALGLNPQSMAKKACELGITKSKKAVAEAKLSIIQEAKADMKLTIDAMGEAAKQRLAEDVLGTMDRVDAYTVADLEDEGKREQVVASVVKRSAAIFGWKEGNEAPAINVAILSALPDRQRDVDT